MCVLSSKAPHTLIGQLLQRKVCLVPLISCSYVRVRKETLRLKKISFIRPSPCQPIGKDVAPIGGVPYSVTRKELSSYIPSTSGRLEAESSLSFYRQFQYAAEVIQLQRMRKSHTPRKTTHSLSDMPGVQFLC